MKTEICGKQQLSIKLYSFHYQTAAVYHRVAKHIENGCKRLVEQWKLQPPKPKD